MFDEFLTPLFSTEWGRRSGLILLLLSSILLVATCIQSIFILYTDLFISRNTKIIITQISTQTINQLVATIPARHLFGKQGGADQDYLPITSLQLRLLGVIKSVPETFSKVIISEHGEPGKIYQLGDSLLSGITINSITDDGVVLENRGHLEKLPLQRTPLQFQGMPTELKN